MLKTLTPLLCWGILLAQVLNALSSDLVAQIALGIYRLVGVLCKGFQGVIQRST
jgi:hypothetical protein